MESSVILFYLLKVACVQAIFFVIYFSLLRRLKFFQLNRFYLLFTSIFSLLAPSITNQGTIVESVAELAPMQATMIPVQQEIVQLEKEWTEPATAIVQADQSIAETSIDLSSSFTMEDLLLSCYASIAFILLIVFIRKVFKLYKIYRGSERVKIGNTWVHSQNVLPISSFFHIIFWSSEKELTPTVAESVLAHELAHRSQWHSLDMVMMELIAMLQWFNPLVHIARKEVASQNEFMADRMAMRHTQNESSYLEILSRFQSEKTLLPAMPLAPFASFLRRRLNALDRPAHSGGHSIVRSL